MAADVLANISNSNSITNTNSGVRFAWPAANIRNTLYGAGTTTSCIAAASIAITTTFTTGICIATASTAFVMITITCTEAIAGIFNQKTNTCIGAAGKRALGSKHGTEDHH